MAFSRFYRHLLPEEYKKIYDLIVNGIENRQERISVPYFNPNDLSRIVNAIIYDNPQLYYFSANNIKYSYIEGKPGSISIVYDIDKSRQDMIDSMIVRNTSSIVEQAKKKSKIEAVKLLHDWLASNCDYNVCDDFSGGEFNIVGALAFRKAKCDGYSKAFKYLSDLVGIKCTVVFGYATDSNNKNVDHAWNLVDIDGKNYHIDVTWDLFRDTDGTKYISESYFMLSDEEINYDHKINDLMNKMPRCNVSGNLIKRVSGTKEVILHLEEEYKKGSVYTEMRLPKSAPKGEIGKKIGEKLRPTDYDWYRHIKSMGYIGSCFFIIWDKIPVNKKTNENYHTTSKTAQQRTVQNVSRREPQKVSQKTNNPYPSTVSQPTPSVNTGSIRNTGGTTGSQRAVSKLSIDQKKKLIITICVAIIILVLLFFRYSFLIGKWEMKIDDIKVICDFRADHTVELTYTKKIPIIGDYSTKQEESGEGKWKRENGNIVLYGFKDDEDEELKMKVKGLNKLEIYFELDGVEGGIVARRVK